MIQYKLTGSTFLFEFLTSILTHFAGVPPSNHCALIPVDKYVFPHFYINPLIFVHSSFSVNIYIYIYLREFLEVFHSCLVYGL